MNGLMTLFWSEWIRFKGVMIQVILPAIITNILYLLIIGLSIGKQVDVGQGVDYLQFLAPGVIMMSMISSAYGGGSGTLFFQRFLGHITNILSVPVSEWDMILTYIFGGLLRGLSVGIVTWIVTIFFIGFEVYNIFAVLYFSIMVMILFSCIGVIIGLIAKEWDHLGAMTTFVITPFTFLGGVFHSIHMLPPTLQKLSLFNPFLYMISGLRYGFIGVADVGMGISVLIVTVFAIIALSISIILFKNGYNLRT